MTGWLAPETGVVGWSGGYAHRRGDVEDVMGPHEGARNDNPGNPGNVSAAGRFVVISAFSLSVVRI